MGSRQKTGGDGVRLPNTNRREIIDSVAMANLGFDKGMAGTATSAEQATDLFGSWLRANVKIERPQNGWAELQSWLTPEHRWSFVSKAEQRETPSAKDLYGIDADVKIRSRRRDNLREGLPMAGAANLKAVIAKLHVSERLAWWEGNAEAQDIIVGFGEGPHGLVRRAGWSIRNGSSSKVRYDHGV